MLNTQALGSTRIKWQVDPKTCVWAPKGRCIVELDYTGQEGLVSAVESKDPVMLSVFTAPEHILDPTGKEVPNPDADLHCITARSIYPEIFKDAQGNLRPKWEWVKISKTKGLIKLPKTPRDIGKHLPLLRVI